MRIAEERKRQEEMRIQAEEQMRFQMQKEEQMRIQMQQEEQMRFQMQQNEMMQQQEKKATKTQGFSYGVRQQDISHIGPKDAQLAMPPMSSSSSVFESSQSAQSQQFSSVQQSSSSLSFSQSSQSTNQIYESQEFNGGLMKGYKVKEELSSDQSGERNVRDSGIFTGINGDSNSLVDEEFDRKKHTVKDLAKHFALVKPKQNIPHNILPEQRIYNGDHGPALNYLGASEADGQVHSLVRREMSQQDVEASKAAYEMKKKQQMEQQQSSSSTTTTTSSTTTSSTVVKRTESSSTTEQEAKSERRMSLRDSLMLDPAQAHADAGIIDPSAILRGCEVTGRRSTSEGVFSQSTVQEFLHKNPAPFFYDFIKLSDKE